MPAQPGPIQSLGSFLRATPERFREWLQNRESGLVWICLAAIMAGAGVFGATLGSWRGGWQMPYAGIKLPLLILLTTLGNGLLNGMLAPLLGLNLGFRQSLMLVLVSFAITSVILGALSPVALFVVWNTPPLTAATKALSPEYGIMQLTLAAFIALAGVIGNARLLPLLRLWTGKAAVARRVLFVWLVCNLFLGSQLCWVLRPFIGDPTRPVEFLGPEPLRGSFFEAVFQATRRLL